MASSPATTECSLWLLENPSRSVRKISVMVSSFSRFFNDTATTEIYTSTASLRLLTATTILVVLSNLP